MLSAHLGGGRFSVKIIVQSLESVQEFNVQGCAVSYQGKKYGEDKQEVLCKADVFVLPTMNDCFPLVILEAMEQGKPIVTTAIGGIPDIVDDEVTGLIAQAGDAQSLAESLGRLLKDNDLATQFGKNGQKKLYEKYTEKVFEKEMVSILEQII